MLVNKENFKNLIRKYFGGQINPEEFQQMRSASAAMSDDELSSEFEQLWMDYSYKDRAKFDLPKVAKQERKYQLWIRRIAAIAAVLLFVIGAQYVVHNNVMRSFKPVIVATAPAQRSSVTLPDGSIIDLNNTSQISYNTNYGVSERRIELKGEALFRVAKAKKPFIVFTDNFSVRVTGTTFNILSRESDNISEVTLLEGSIEIASKLEPNNIVKLSGKQKVSIDHMSGKVAVLEADESTDTAWLKSEFAFKGKTLLEILKYIEITKGVKFIVNNTPQDKRFTGRFAEGNINEILDILSIHYDFSYTKEQGEIVINLKE